jgi:hypothetical protein
MANQTNKTRVYGYEEQEGTFVERKKRFLIFFETTYWEQVSTKSLGNDIYIETDRPIKNVYINGKLFKHEKRTS